MADKGCITYIVLDESGAMHKKNDRYFVIAGFITTELHKSRSIHRQVDKTIRCSGSMSPDRELKASFLKPHNKALFINELISTNSVTPIAIVVDKHVLRKRNIEENVAYNLLVKTLLTYLLTYYPNYFPFDKISLILDNRSIKIKYKNELETYLDWEIGDLFCKDFTVDYRDSKHFPEVQMSDYIANAIYGRYNYINTEVTSTLIPKFNTFIISKFPYKDFEEPKKGMCNKDNVVQKEEILIQT